MTEKTNKLYETATAAIAAMNEAVASDSYKGIAEAKGAMTKAFEELNAQVITEAFDGFLATENPMLSAIKQGYVDLYASKSERNNLTGAESWVMSKKENVVIDIVSLEKHAKRKIFANGQWVWWIERFIHCLTQKAIEEIGTAEEKEKYLKNHQLSETARKCDVGANPTSYASLTKALQAVVDGIIFEDNGKGLNKWKIDKRDVKYLIYLAFRKGKGKRSIAIPKDTTVVSLITEVCNRLVTGGEYVFE